MRKEEGLDLKKIIFSKLNRKLTILFIIVAILAPTLGIYYFYNIAISSMPAEVSTAEIFMLRTIAITIIVLIAIDAGIIGFFVSRSITKPIRELHRATKEVEKGNYDVRLQINSGDEFQELANAFNSTTAALGKLQIERNEIDTAKSEFLSITSHELRSPMTPMKAQLQMLEQGYFGKLSAKQKESLNIVVRNADRLDRIIVDFLEISRIEAARLKFNFRETDISNTILETVQFMEGFAHEKNIKLKVKLDTIPIIEADPDRINQVLRNLIHNAIKFSKEKSNIEIEAIKENDHISFSVKDYGCGLSNESQMRIFEPFYQVENTNRRKHGGTGLGLAICRGIVESQKGKIWVESKEGSGSKFNFTFPLTPVRKIEPIKVLFSNKVLVERKIKEEFQTILGPLGIGEFEDLKNRNSLDKTDIFTYIDSLTEKYILTQETSQTFKTKIKNIYGEEKENVFKNTNNLIVV